MYENMDGEVSGRIVCLPLGSVLQGHLPTNRPSTPTAGLTKAAVSLQLEGASLLWAVALHAYCIKIETQRQSCTPPGPTPRSPRF